MPPANSAGRVVRVRFRPLSLAIVSTRIAVMSRRVVTAILDLLHAGAQIVIMRFDFVFCAELRLRHAAAMKSERSEIEE